MLVCSFPSKLSSFSATLPPVLFSYNFYLPHFGLPYVLMTPALVLPAWWISSLFFWATFYWWLFLKNFPLGIFLPYTTSIFLPEWLISLCALFFHHINGFIWFLYLTSVGWSIIEYSLQPMMPVSSITRSSMPSLMQLISLVFMNRMSEPSSFTPTSKHERQWHVFAP